MNENYFVYCEECSERVDGELTNEAAAAALVGHGLRTGHQDVFVRKEDHAETV